MALRADFPSGMNITARGQGERDERSFCLCVGNWWRLLGSVELSGGRRVNVGGGGESRRRLS